MKRAALVLLLLAFPGLSHAEDDKESESHREDSQTSVRAQQLGKNQSGVFVNGSAENSGYSPRFVMRGFPGGLTLFDGAAHGFTSQVVDLSTVDHVEFFKGPSAMLFGKALGGYGGAANYLQKEPSDEIFARGMIANGAFDVHRANADLNTPIAESKNLNMRITGSTESVGSFVNFVRSRSFDIAPMFAFKAENGDRITLRGEHNGSRLVYRDGVPATPIFFHVPREFYAGAPVNEHETPSYDDVTMSYEHAFNKDWRVRAVVDYYLRSNRWGWFTGWGYDGFRSVTFGQPVRTRTGIRNFDAQLRLHGRFNTGAFGHSVFLGLEHWDYFTGHSDSFARDALSPIDIFRPTYPIGINYAGAQWANGVARAWSQSVYAQDLIDITPQWRILLGGRYDLLAQRERVFDPLGALSGAPTVSVNKGIRGYFSPRAGLLFTPYEDSQIFLAYGQSLIPNTGARVQSGEAPAPQQDTQYEIGIKRYFLDHKLAFEIGLFDITRNHVAITNPANPSGFYSIVTGQQHSHGIELNAGGEILPNLKVNGVATFLHAVVSKDSNTPSQLGSDLLGAPRRVYSVSVNYTFDSGDFKGVELGASYYYASRAQATLPNTFGFVLPPQQMLGASLAYKISDQLKLEVNATNLTNQSNWTSNGALSHGEPRGFLLSLNGKY